MARATQAHTLTGLAARLRERAAALPVAANTAKQITSEHVLQRLGQAMPVDTSKAVSNLQVATRAPVTHEVPAYFPGVGGSTHAASLAAMLDVGVLIIRTTATPGEPVTISSVIDYIAFLADGGSPQQPSSGWISRELITAQQLAMREIKARKVFA